MLKQRLIYFAAASGIGLAVLLALDQIVKAHKKNQLPHIANNAGLLAGGILAILFSGLLIYAFTGTLVPLAIFAAMVSVAVGSAYAWRLKCERETNALWETMLAEEELQAGETAERDPANAAAWAHLARLKEKRGDLRRALELFSIACKLEPTQLNLDRLASLREKVEALPPARTKDPL